MDKVRLVVGAIWRERFWVLTTIGVLVAVGCWYMAAAELDKEFASRKSAISSTFSSMQTLSSEVNHPNTNVIDGDKEQARKMRDVVLEQWESLYAEQRDKVLKWPAQNLKPEFIEAIEKLKFRDPFPPKLANNMRSEYSNYIGKRFDGLLEIVQARKLEGNATGASRAGPAGRFGGEYGGEMDFGGGRGGSPRSGGDELEDDYLVDWLDQANLRAKLDFQSRPTSLQIWVTQEDLWVYETLLNVIANTNEAKGATRPDNTAVGTIVTLEVGKEAALAGRQQGQIIMASGDDGGGAGGRSRGEYGPQMFEGGGGRELGGRYEGGYPGGEDAEISDDVVLANRYLKADGEPFPSGPEDPEFRRLPIVMELQMDQRWLPHLLVECANAALPVEVDKVSINPDQSGGMFGGGGSSGYGGARTARTPQAPERGAGMPNPNLATVFIRGVVYIYNQPDSSVLSLPGLDEPGDDSLQASN